MANEWHTYPTLLYMGNSKDYVENAKKERGVTFPTLVMYVTINGTSRLASIDLD